MQPASAAAALAAQGQRRWDDQDAPRCMGCGEMVPCLLRHPLARWSCPMVGDARPDGLGRGVEQPPGRRRDDQVGDDRLRPTPHPSPARLGPVAGGDPHSGWSDARVLRRDLHERVGAWLDRAGMFRSRRSLVARSHSNRDDDRGIQASQIAAAADERPKRRTSLSGPTAGWSRFPSPSHGYRSENPGAPGAREPHHVFGRRPDLPVRLGRAGLRGLLLSWASPAGPPDAATGSLAAPRGREVSGLESRA